jgi:hypothetical protein
LPHSSFSIASCALARSLSNEHLSAPSPSHPSKMLCTEVPARIRALVRTPTLMAHYRSRVLDQSLQDEHGGATADVVAFYRFLAGHLADKLRRLNNESSALLSPVKGSAHKFAGRYGRCFSVKHTHRYILMYLHTCMHAYMHPVHAYRIYIPYMHTCMQACIHVSFHSCMRARMVIMRAREEKGVWGRGV